MPIEYRMAMLLLAGVDGDLGELSKKSWVEFPPDERIAVQVAIRSLHGYLSGCSALRVRAGDHGV